MRPLRDAHYSGHRRGSAIYSAAGRIVLRQAQARGTGTCACAKHSGSGAGCRAGAGAGVGCGGEGAGAAAGRRFRRLVEQLAEGLEDLGVARLDGFAVTAEELDEDDDCDGEIDEGQLNECNECGIIPAEICDGIDNDCDGTTDEDLIQPCSTACGVGYEMCFDGNWISCNAPPVNEEICDGLDNDCDGAIDEDLNCVCTIQDIGVLFPCQEDPLLCGQGYKTCECIDKNCTQLTMTDCYALCYWIPPADPSDICDPLIGMPLNEEECNNFDDNCNQLIDEDL